MIEHATRLYGTGAAATLRELDNEPAHPNTPGPASEGVTVAAECKAKAAALIIEQILGEADALFRQKLEDGRLELPWLLMVVAPDDQVLLKGNVSADVLRSLSAALNDAADGLAASELDAAAH